MPISNNGRCIWNKASTSNTTGGKSFPSNRPGSKSNGSSFLSRLATSTGAMQRSYPSTGSSKEAAECIKRLQWFETAFRKEGEQIAKQQINLTSVMRKISNMTLDQEISASAKKQLMQINQELAEIDKALREH